MDARTKYSGNGPLSQGAGAGQQRQQRPGKFTSLGGIALAFDKLVACDSSNYRLQVFEARRSDSAHWGKLIRVIRRGCPTASCASARRWTWTSGPTARCSCSTLDAVWKVAVLTSRFERIGAFGKQ